MPITIAAASVIKEVHLLSLLQASEREGFTFIRRFVDEWTAGINRFDRKGERLFIASSAERIAGICGLNIDPYIDDMSVGRVRRLYVIPEFRQSGIGRRLVQSVIEAARDVFQELRLRTTDLSASRLYERLGFRVVQGIPDCTHVRSLTDR